MFSLSPLKSHRDSKAAKKFLELQKNILMNVVTLNRQSFQKIHFGMFRVEY